ncbi:MAG: cbb3-type cytochrome c oxidase subunit I [Daejeonella sp.]|uniref:cbb3-type cytochrome c oxidase subunit I n=1 Tax=Daejeonella sp. TaxID=2805397 RepID=UPI002737080F|nr:cbb3-type cytochrome c oxidase subunit I [Daejeonella sp.]MDP3468144.1 cbb3-type cytochrome c oxidase subunit I [Daejeonella sp.]
MKIENILNEWGIIITIILIAIPVIVASIIVILRANTVVSNYFKKKELEKFNEYIKDLHPEEVQKLEQRKKELEFALSNNELAGETTPIDTKGLINHVSQVEALRFIEQKKKSQPRPYIEPQLSKLILWYLGCATFWLVFGTTVGEYLGIKFVAPDVDHYSWLSFGRLRPVHTNAVFWGWASLAMMGLAYYVIPRVSNVPIASIKTGYRSLILINTSVIIGSICLMAGINNGGGEYREYIWPVMALFGIGILISLRNFFKTIAKRTNKEIYVSNWYIISAMMYLLVIAFVAYWPGWQRGLGETIVQGYYMHQGVGMWFMLFNLGLMYYFLPQQLNRPIYSYSLGILAFWTQILFYTLIGTHHFIFSAIPWWLQTVAIVGSAGMIIPVVAGTTNFLMTFKGSWNKLSGSYTLPFYLIGIIFYFTGSLQGTAEAFRFTNLVWHFTDFTVAHSHLTMYGIICFMLWGFIYTIVPRLTGNEPPQITVGAHFWLALIGLIFYSFPLMYGATLRGLMWMDGKPFIESVELMAPYWMWRAIGGSLMWLSHILFAYNFYVMVRRKEEIIIPESPIDILKAKLELDKQTITNK